MIMDYLCITALDEAGVAGLCHIKGDGELIGPTYLPSSTAGPLTSLGQAADGKVCSSSPLSLFGSVAQ